jgi:hypothetical protein
MGKWIRPRPTPEEIDEWDFGGKHYELAWVPRVLRLPLSALIILVAIPLAAIAAIYAEIGYALHRLVSHFASPSW